MTGIEIRRATPADVPAMARIVCDWEARTDWMPAIYGPEEIAGYLRDALPEREMWVAGNPVQGYLSYDPEKRRVGGLYCCRSGAGFGKALMDRVKEGRDYIWLTTHEPNLAAQRFYAREGFEEIARLDPEPPQTVREVKMEWRA